MTQLTRINIYPIKSFDAHGVKSATMLASGNLEHDRRFAVRDSEGQLLNAKRTPAMHRLRSEFDLPGGTVSLRVGDSARTHEFHLHHDRAKLGRWLSGYFDEPVELVENSQTGFPDDTDALGPTVISTATLELVGRWFGNLPLDEVRRRFRANLEVDDVEPFWEDRLLADEGRFVRFRVGDAELLGSHCCQRCAVPGRHSLTGEPIKEFAMTFAQRRAESLPAWSPRARFDHFYRLAVNTRPANCVPALLHVGDQVSIVGIE